MNVLIVYWHPEPKSFNYALFNKAVETFSDAGHQVKTSDLFKMGFDPASTRKNFNSVKDPDYFKPQIEEMYATEANGFSKEIETEIEKLEWCDLMIWQFPLWWFSLPAVMKGWVDRVFAMGRIYGGGKIYDTGVFRGKKALLSLTTGGPKEAYLKDGFNGDIYGILKPIHRGMLWFVGFDVLEPHVVNGPVRLTDEQRKNELESFATRLRQIQNESPMDVGRY
ncbi:MAG: NAD(P)H-dependent oxidoreductase [Gammaproteobacteria bacterium]|nr:NAD(P)H-dependent oxidoreductase [Gammaproteobacteria bacterium]MCP5424854.1 NAD(P)H-dependent oxidoreductase [Gammaproteobacteria bacterium]MCP5458169.1 NAD(P)H-dependent oxidoreductase [Gammaproteobacteria bacterium]